MSAANPVHCFVAMVFTRYPVPGQTKTRLISHLGAVAAADLQRQMTEYVLDQVLQAAQGLPLAVQVHFAGGTLEQMQDWLGDRPTVALHPQCQGGLGDRLTAAFDRALAQGHRGAIALGSDCPALGSDHLAAALSALDGADVALGPATDGGYYLLGLRQPQPFLFQGIDWGSDRVLSQTLALARAHRLTVAQLSPLSDIDRPADLPQWEQILAQAAQANSS